MESKFPQRVSVERRALDLINGSQLFPCELVGVGGECVDLWFSKVAHNDLLKDELGPVYEVLIEIAFACHAEADISDEIFEDIAPERAEAVLQELGAVLGSVVESRRGNA